MPSLLDGCILTIPIDAMPADALVLACHEVAGDAKSAPSPLVMTPDVTDTIYVREGIHEIRK